jgi:hypothetical protein
MCVLVRRGDGGLETLGWAGGCSGAWVYGKHHAYYHAAWRNVPVSWQVPKLYL